jgi:hypothetical protein
MLPPWLVELSVASGAAFVPGWTNLEVATLAFVVFAAAFLAATLLAANWPTDIAFLTLVTGGLLVAWPAMIGLSLAAVMWAMIVSGLHAVLAPRRTARISADAARQVAPALDAFARDAGLADTQRQRVLADSDARKP